MSIAHFDVFSVTPYNVNILQAFILLRDSVICKQQITLRFKQVTCTSCQNAISTPTQIPLKYHTSSVVDVLSIDVHECAVEKMVYGKSS